MTNVKTVKLAAGSHNPGEGKACVMEVVSMLAGEPFSDQPECACPVLTAFAIHTNDWMRDDERLLLWPFTTRLAGSKADKATEQQRAFRMADWAVREIAPIALEARGKKAQADRLRSLAPVVDTATTRAANAAAHAANAAAYDAANAAARAANAAAHAANAAAHAAGDAAHAAAYDAANAAAAAYARKDILQMRLALLDELCPPAPMPDDAVATEIARQLEEAAA